MRSHRARRSTNFWPGFVDALSTLVMVVIFVLLVFMIAQYFLTTALTGRNEALARLTQQMNELSDMLAMERSEKEELRASVAQLSAELQSATSARDDLSGQLAALLDSKAELESALAEAQQKVVANEKELVDAYKTVDADKETIQAQLAELALLKSLKDQMDAELARLNAAADDKDKQIAGLQSDLADAQSAIAQAQADLQDTQAKLAETEAALDASQDALAASQAATGQSQEALDEQSKMTDEARRQVELLNAQLMQLRSQLADLMAALDASEQKNQDQEVQIANLGQRLNEALATKVQELARYRSEFFGRMREVLGDRQDIRIVGDRFVFQSEVLFKSGEATLGPEGEAQLAALATTLKEIIPQIPQEIDWVLQVNGHTDKRPVVNSPFASNWELSQARALSVVRFLISQGLPPNRLAAAGFAEFQPLDNSDSEDAYRANRRIEIKLTER